MCDVAGQGKSEREKERESERERERERESFTTVMSNIPDILCVSRHDVLAQQNIHKRKAETSTANLSYVKNTCVSMLLHICWNESTFPLVGVPKVVFRLYLNQVCEGGISQFHISSLCSFLNKLFKT